MQIRPTQITHEHRTGRIIRIVPVTAMRPAPSRSRRIFLPSPPQPEVSPRTSGEQEPECAHAALEDTSPAARAWRTRRKLRRLFKDASQAAKGQARIRRADEYQLLKCAYAAVRRWHDDGVAEEIATELRAEAHVAISRSSSLLLVLIRSALPRLDAKRASKWAAALAFAAHRGVGSNRLIAFLGNNGGIEGAARMMTKLRASGDG